MSWEFPIMGLTQGMKVHRMDMTLCCIQDRIKNIKKGYFSFRNRNGGRDPENCNGGRLRNNSNYCYPGAHWVIPVELGLCNSSNFLYVLGFFAIYRITVYFFIFEFFICGIFLGKSMPESYLDQIQDLNKDTNQFIRLYTKSYFNTWTLFANTFARSIILQKSIYTKLC